ncbi:MAG: PDR/VanB family oxidoreductase [Gammaproteobacteria bacterium]|nr:PDR/VanB family oxidoreductase [Gammaproteobacteria bacterium]MBU1440034.1 PDR/VanB family oxidoreductase [Gammaproteobacteria bacterium]MBU2287399.1 PDR/VanB family oxidoreductase [Gammaproteobacteria bacterium]
MPASSPSTLSMRVVQARELNPLIRLFRLQSADGAALPPYTAGAHVRVQVELPGGAQDWRHYSLVNFDERGDATDAPSEYVIAVRKEEAGRGGSRFMHERLREGDTVAIEPPKNDFPLHEGPGGTLLLAGGIGVTPLASMAARRCAQGLPVRMHYAGRSRELMAFLPELQAMLGGGLRVHSDAEQGAPLDVGAVLDDCPAGWRLYVCGPKVLLDAVLAQTGARGWDHDRVHFELFTTPEVEEGDHAFEVELAHSGQRFTVPADQSILDCLITNGCDPLYDCKRGECGVCAVPVIDGEIDHRDYVLSAREKAEGNVMQICISRAKGQRLVLDI